MASKIYILPPKHIKMTQRPPDFTINKGHSLAQGLVFAGLGKFPGTNQYTESSGYGNNGTLTGFTTAGDTPIDKWQWIPQLRRMGLGFDRVNDIVTVTNFNHNIGSGDFTFSCWILPSSVASDYMFSFQTNLPSMGIYGGIINLFWVGIGDYNSTGSISANVLWHIVFRRTGTALRFFINGVLDAATPTCNTSLTSNTLYIGTGYTVYGGVVGDLLIHNRALSPAEITALAEPSNVMLSGLLSAPRRKYISFPTAAAGSILKISSVSWTNVNKVSSVAKASIKKVSGVSAV